MRRVPRVATRAASPPPIDPLTGPPLALAGRVVTMNARYQVVRSGVVYIDKGTIVAVRPRTQPPPVGFETVPVVETGGTLYPGLIELHNHLSYNLLRSVAGAQGIHQSRAVGEHCGIPQTHQWADAGDRPYAPSTAGAGALCRV